MSFCFDSSWFESEDMKFTSFKDEGDNIRASVEPFLKQLLIFIGFYYFVSTIA